MNNQWNRSLVDLSALLVAGALLATSVASNALAAEGAAGARRVGMSEGWEIPTQLSNEPREDEPDGACSRCTVDDLGVDHSNTNDASAQLQLYFEDNGEDAIADIHVRILLSDDSYETLVIPNAELVDGQVHVFELEPHPGWTWEDVLFAWVSVG